MTHTNIIRAALAAATITLIGFAAPTAVEATGDVYNCPAGTVHNYKIDGLSGKTFTVPTPPSGWTVEAVILKVGGGGNGADVHQTFTPVTPGQTLTVTGKHDISHAHICKGIIEEETTTTWPAITTTIPVTPSTSTTIVAPTSTVPVTTISSSVPNPTVPETSVSNSTPPPPTQPCRPSVLNDGCFPVCETGYPQGYSADDPCGPVDPCVAVDPVTGIGSTLWTVQRCSTPVVTPSSSPPAAGQSLPETGPEHAWGMAIAATFLLFGGWSLVAFARRGDQS